MFADLYDMSALSVPVQQTPLAQPPPSTNSIATDPSLLAAINACAAEFQLPDRTDGDLWGYYSPSSATQPTCDPRDPGLGNPNSSLGSAPKGDVLDYGGQFNPKPAKTLNPPRRWGSDDDHSHSNSNSNPDSRRGSDTCSSGRAVGRRRKNSMHSGSISPSSPGSTVDAKSQRAKFLERNRIAASKCRQRKKEQMMELESRFKEQSRKKDELMAQFSQLRLEVLELKNEVLKHAGCDDMSIRRHLAQSAAMSAAHCGPGSALPVSDGPSSMAVNGSRWIR